VHAIFEHNSNDKFFSLVFCHIQDVKINLQILFIPSRAGSVLEFLGSDSEFQNKSGSGFSRF